MARKDVETHIIKKLIEGTYGPYGDLQYKFSLIEDPPESPRAQKDRQFDAYYRLLEPFDGKTLEMAWYEVVARHQTSVWPQPSKLLKAAEAIARETDTVEQRERRAAAEKMAKSYVPQWQAENGRRKFYREAKAGKWLPDLLLYVEAAALVQAEHIHGVNGRTVPTVLFEPEKNVETSVKKMTDEILEISAEANARGEIAVTVPQAAQVYFRQKAKGEDEYRRPKSSGGDAGLDEAMERMRRRVEEAREKEKRGRK